MATWYRCCQRGGTCVNRFGQAGVCESFDEITHSEGTNCADFLCDAIMELDASCCIFIDGILSCETMTIGDCWALPFLRGKPELPPGCGLEISCVGGVDGACCVGEECMEVTRAECTEASGDSFHEGKTCAEVFCQEPVEETGCRSTRRIGRNFTGYEPGDKNHSLDLCETVVQSSVRHRSVGGADLGGDVQPGYVTPVTAHEVRARRVSVTQDPCRRYIGMWAKGPDGYVRPYQCSQPEAGVSSARLNEGFFFKQVGEDEQDRLRPGYVGGLVGVETPRWNEVVFRFNPALCKRPLEPGP